MFRQFPFIAPFLVWLIPAAVPAVADEVCLEYDTQGQVIVGAMTAEKSRVAMARETLDRFLEDARRNDIDEILRHYSEYDNSRAAVRRELEQLPDKFSGYAGLQSAGISEAFAWGDYVLALVNYRHERGEITLMEAFFCTPNLCQVSNVFERPGGAEDLMSRWIGVYRGGQSRTSCPSADRSFEVWPTVANRREDPLAAYIGPDLTPRSLGAEYLAELAAEAPQIHGCLQSLAEMELDQAEADAALELTRGWVNRCATNMSERSIVPAIQVGETATRNLLTPASLLMLGARTSAVARLLQLEGASARAHVLVLEGPYGHYVVTAPIARTAAGPRFDWEFYGQALGELLVSSQFGQFVKSRRPELFE